MKKNVILTGLCLVCVLATRAQNMRFGFTAGTTFANYHAKSPDETENGNSKIGFTVGVVMDAPIGDHVSFQPALHFVQKGTKDEVTFGGITEKMSMTTNHIEIPLNFLYNSNGQSGNFFIGAGPSVAFGLSGKSKYEDDQTSVETDVQFGDSDEDDLKGFDLGANIIAGYRFPNGLFIAANFNKGLSNLVPGENPDDVKFKSSYFGIRLGFLLGGNKAEKK